MSVIVAGRAVRSARGSSRSICSTPDPFVKRCSKPEPDAIVHEATARFRGVAARNAYARRDQDLPRNLRGAGPIRGGREHS